ncbi:MAG: ATP-binding cassette domain-containing protein [Actinomycetota bacterium]
MPDLEIRDLTIEYSKGGYVVRPIDDLNLHAPDGELVVLLGPSGCGKTTLLSVLGGILKPTKGLALIGSTSITHLDGNNLNEYRRRGVGICFQAFNLIPSLTALENVAAPLLISGVSGSQAKARASQLLATVNMTEREHHRPGNLSGGQQQRVAIARALAYDPPLLLADEPTANLDYIQAESVIRLLRELAGPGRLIVVSTHDDRMVPIADKVVELAPHFRADTGPPQRMSFDEGQTIYEQGERGELIYVIGQGQVATVRVRDDRTEEPVSKFGPGDYFGELGPLLDFPRESTARALTKVSVTAYGQRDFKEQILNPQRRREPERPSIIGSIGASQIENIRPSLIGSVQAREMPTPAPRAPAAQPVASQATPSQPSVVTPAGAPLKFCGNCGTPRNSGDKFCGVCGRSFPVGG